MIQMSKETKSDTEDKPKGLTERLVGDNCFWKDKTSDRDCYRCDGLMFSCPGYYYTRLTEDILNK